MTDLATAVERSPATVRRHLRILESCGAIEVVRGSGARAPTFRATARSVFSDDEWAQLPVQARRALFSGALARVGEHVASAMAGGGFDRPDAHVSWVPTSLDELGHAQINELLVEVFERVMAIQAGAEARRGEQAPLEGEIESEVVVLHFLRKPDRAAPASAPPATGRSRQRMYALLDDLADELPGDLVDWQRVGRHVIELAELVDAQRRGHESLPG